MSDEMQLVVVVALSVIISALSMLNAYHLGKVAGRIENAKQDKQKGGA